MKAKLELFSDGDIPQLMKWVDKPGAADLWASRTYQYPVSRDTILTHLKKVENDPIELVVFKIVNEMGETLGHAELDKFDHHCLSARITRVFIDPKYRNQGIAQQTTRLLLDYCFEKLNLNRVEIFALEKNQIALNVYENSGFTIEGLIRNNMLLGEELHDSYILSILKSEYKLQKNKHEDNHAIKKAQFPKDAEKVFSLLKELRTELTLNDFVAIYKQAHKNDNYQLVFIEEDNSPVALMGYRILHDFVHGKHLYIDDLVTKSDQRSKGYGAKLLAYAESVASGLQCKGLRLCTGIENERGKNFYTAHNWSPRSVAFKKKLTKAY